MLEILKYTFIILLITYILTVSIYLIVSELKDRLYNDEYRKIIGEIRELKRIRRNWEKVISSLSDALEDDYLLKVESFNIEEIEVRIENLNRNLKMLLNQKRRIDIKEILNALKFLFKTLDAFWSTLRKRGAYLKYRWKRWGKSINNFFLYKKKEMNDAKNNSAYNSQTNKGKDLLSESELVLWDKVEEEGIKTRKANEYLIDSYKKKGNTIRETNIVFEVKFGLVNLGAKFFGFFFS